ncbi:PREDICTED: mitogen-activated protein kinase kinase kinase 10-like [Branchiostoma belcheri]|uniref:non-specific protein-tyrosine kinase n=1 Tax=Branchiostoma belcheri TaxID=7741 RepID=A0A6P4Z1B9_BRABE|nr:PREDICTED: mitogen-activated protein kinase kinase kinase 10-like [Branchiostoma belcheri]
MERQPSKTKMDVVGDKNNDLFEFLVGAELEMYTNAFKETLKVNSVAQLRDVDKKDLQIVGMSRPEQKRFKRYYDKRFGTWSKLKKVFKRETESKAAPTDRLPTSPANVGRDRHLIPSDAITINYRAEPLGKGEFGIVYRGVWRREDGQRIQCAVKTLTKEKFETAQSEFFKEATIMCSMEHDNIVRLYGIVLDLCLGSLMMVSELAPLRSLSDCLRDWNQRPLFPVSVLCDLAIQISSGMQYLDTKGLVHRDLAARNILVFSPNLVKVSDFGLTRALGVGRTYFKTATTDRKLPFAWCAPEAINEFVFTSATDVWSFAVTMWEMFSYGEQPWATYSGEQIRQAIGPPMYHRLERPRFCPFSHYRIMHECWSHKPKERPTFTKLCHVLEEAKPEQRVAIADVDGDVVHDLMTLKAGDVITVLEKPSDSHGWLGALDEDKIGFFDPEMTEPFQTEAEKQEMAAAAMDKKRKLKKTPQPSTVQKEGNHYETRPSSKHDGFNALSKFYMSMRGKRRPGDGQSDSGGGASSSAERDQYCSLQEDALPEKPSDTPEEEVPAPADSGELKTSAVKFELPAAQTECVGAAGGETDRRHYQNLNGTDIPEEPDPDVEHAPLPFSPRPDYDVPRPQPRPEAVGADADGQDTAVDDVTYDVPSLNPRPSTMYFMRMPDLGCEGLLDEVMSSFSTETLESLGVDEPPRSRPTSQAVKLAPLAVEENDSPIVTRTRQRNESAPSELHLSEPEKTKVSSSKALDTKGKKNANGKNGSRGRLLNEASRQSPKADTKDLKLQASKKVTGVGKSHLSSRTNSKTGTDVASRQSPKPLLYIKEDQSTEKSTRPHSTDRSQSRVRTSNGSSKPAVKPAGKAEKKPAATCQCGRNGTRPAGKGSPSETAKATQKTSPKDEKEETGKKPHSRKRDQSQETGGGNAVVLRKLVRENRDRRPRSGSGEDGLVKFMKRALPDEATPEMCSFALQATNCNVEQANKFVKLQLRTRQDYSQSDLRAHALRRLKQNNWDINKTTRVLLGEEEDRHAVGKLQ